MNREIKSVYDITYKDHNKNGERTEICIIHYSDGTNKCGDVKDPRIFKEAFGFILRSDVLSTLKSHTFNTLSGIESTTIEYKVSRNQAKHVYYIRTGCKRTRVSEDIFERTKTNKY